MIDSNTMTIVCALVSAALTVLGTIAGLAIVACPFITAFLAGLYHDSE